MGYMALGKCIAPNYVMAELKPTAQPKNLMSQIYKYKRGLTKSSNRPNITYLTVFNCQSDHDLGADIIFDCA